MWYIHHPESTARSTPWYFRTDRPILDGISPCTIIKHTIDRLLLPCVFVGSRVLTLSRWLCGPRTPDPGPRTPDHTTSRLDEFRLPKDTGNQKSHRSDFVDTIQCDTGRRPIRLCPLKKKWPPTKTPTVRRSSHDASDLRCSGIVGMTRTPPIDTNKPQSKCLGLGIH